MPSSTPGRLRDYANAEVHARCGRCKRQLRLNLMKLARQVGWDMPLTALLAILACADCGQVGMGAGAINEPGAGRIAVDRLGRDKPRLS